MKINVNVSSKLPTIYRRSLATLGQSFVGRLSRQPFFFTRSSDFPNDPKAGCRVCDGRIELRTVAVYQSPFQTLVVVIPTDSRPVTIEIIVRFTGRGLSRRQMSKITGVSPEAIWKVLGRIRETSSLTRVLHGHRLTKITPNEVPYLYSHDDSEQVTRIVQGQGWNLQANWTLCLCLRGTKTFSSR